MTGCWYSRTYAYLVLTAELLRVQYVMTRIQHSRSHHFILSLFPTLTFFSHLFYSVLWILRGWYQCCIYGWAFHTHLFSVCWPVENLCHQWPMRKAASLMKTDSTYHKLWCLKGSLVAIGHFSKTTVVSRVDGLHSHELLTEYQMWIASCEITIQ